MIFRWESGTPVPPLDPRLSPNTRCLYVKMLLFLKLNIRKRTLELVGDPKRPPGLITLVTSCKKMSMSRKCHNPTPQTNTCRRKEKIQNTNSHMAAKKHNAAFTLLPKYRFRGCRWLAFVDYLPNIVTFKLDQ